MTQSLERFGLRFQSFAPADPAGGGAAAGGGGGDDFAGFDSDSASVAFTPAPEDTTAGLEQVSESAPEPTEQGGDASSTVETSASTAGVSEPPTVAGTSGSGKKSKTKTFEERVRERQRALDRTTAEIARANEQLAAARRELEDTHRQIAAAKGGPQGDAGTPPAAAAAEPEHPKYREFDTDEAYEEAIAKWRTDHAAWQQRRFDEMRSEISEGIESRFRTGDAISRMGETLKSVRSTKADWEEKSKALQGVTSAWYDPQRHGPSPTPFLSDLAQSRMMRGDAEGAELLYWLASDPDRAQRVADLRPNRPLRDALVHAPSAIALLEHFATDQGAEEFEEIKRLHPVQMLQVIGALAARLQPASSSGPGAAHPVTKARPSATPQVGSPGARAARGGDGASQSFDDWMAAEDEREQTERLRRAGLAGSR